MSSVRETVGALEHISVRSVDPHDPREARVCRDLVDRLALTGHAPNVGVGGLVWRDLFAPSPASGAQRPSWSRSSAELGLSQLADRSRTQPTEGDRPDRGPRQPQHRVADLGEQPADDVVAALVQHHLDHRLPARRARRSGTRRAAPGRPRACTPASTVRTVAGRHRALDLGDVGLRQLERRMRQPVRELAVVGQHDQPVGVGVEPADVEEPLRSVADAATAGRAGPPRRPSS